MKEFHEDEERGFEEEAWLMMLSCRSWEEEEAVSEKLPQNANALQKEIDETFQIKKI